MTLTANALVFFDQTAVSVALVDISADLGASSVQEQSVITAYLLALAVTMPIAGRLADHLGRRRVFVAGLGVFAAGSLACAAAPTISVLLVARFVQGLGGAVLQPVSLGTTTRTVSRRDRGWAIGLLSTGGTSFLALGPLIAGLLLTVGSWRLIFVVTLPVLVFVIVAAMRWIAPSREETPVPVPVVDVVLLFGALTGIVVGIVGLSSWGAWSAVPAGAGIVLGWRFGRRSRRSADAVLPLAMLHSWALAAPLTALVAIQFAVLSLSVYLMLYLQRALGFGPAAAAVVLGAAGVATPLLSLTAGRLSDAGATRRLVVGGLAIGTVGLTALGLVAPLRHGWWLVPGLVLIGLSRPMVFTPASGEPLSRMTEERRGVASSLVTEARQLGALLGVALCGLAWSASGAATVDAAAPDVASGFLASTLVAAAVMAAAALINLRHLRPPPPEVD